MPPDTIEMAKVLMKEPVTILLKNEELFSDRLRQYFIDLDKEEWKFETLVECLNYIGNSLLHNYNIYCRISSMHYLLQHE